jgi:hypothetical protein
MRWLALLPFCLFLVGCTPTITKKEYDKKCAEAVNLQNTLTGNVYYQGSKKGYDYFLFEPSGALSHHVRVRQGEVALTTRVPYTTDKRKWIAAYPDWAGVTNVVFQASETNK